MSLETERGLPLALGNSLGPVAERGSSNGAGAGREGGKELEQRVGTEGWNLKGCCTRELLQSGVSVVVVVVVVLPRRVHTRGELLAPLLGPNIPTSHLRPTSPPPSSNLRPLFPLSLCALLPFQQHILSFFFAYLPPAPLFLMLLSRVSC